MSIQILFIISNEYLVFQFKSFNNELYENWRLKQISIWWQASLTVVSSVFWYGHLFFNSYYQSISIWSFKSRTNCKTVFGIAKLDFRDLLLRGSEYPTSSLRDIGVKIGQNWWSICRALRPVRELFNNHRVCCKKTLENHFRISWSKIDFCKSELKIIGLTNFNSECRQNLSISMCNVGQLYPEFFWKWRKSTSRWIKNVTSI